MLLPAVLAAFAGLRTATEEQMTALLDALRRELAPVTALEIILVDQILVAVTRLRRAARMEQESASKIDKDWMRYEQLAERGFWKAYNELRKERKARSAPPRAAKSAPVPQPMPELPVEPEPKPTRRPEPPVEAQPQPPAPAMTAPEAGRPSTLAQITRAASGFDRPGNRHQRRRRGQRQARTP